MINKTPVKQAMPILLVDWVVILLCVPLGLLLLQNTLDSEKWNARVGTAGELPIVQITRNSGIAKVRPSTSPTWRNVWKPMSLSAGDEVRTSSDSRATLGTPSGGYKIELKGNTWLRIDHAVLGEESWKKLFLRKPSQTPWVPAILEGKIRVTLLTPNLPVPVLLPGGTRILLSWRVGSTPKREDPAVVLSSAPASKPELGGYLENTSPEDLLLELPGSHQTQILPGMSKWEISVGSSKIARSTFSSDELGHSPLLEPPAPSPLSPINGSKFLSLSKDKEEISLRWKPILPPYKADIEVQKLDDAPVPQESQTTATGAVAHLRDGQYEWKLRVLLNGKPVTPWSAPMGFSIQENLMAAPPRVVKLSVAEKRGKRAHLPEATPARVADLPELRRSEVPTHSSISKSVLKGSPSQGSRRPASQANREKRAPHPRANRIAEEFHFDHPAERQSVSPFSPVEFSWTPKGEADRFDFQLSKDNQFHEMEYEAKESSPKIYLTLSEAGSYFWRIRKARDPATQAWSSPRTLYVR